MNKVLYGFILVLFITAIVGSFTVDFDEYQLDNSISAIEPALNDWINRGVEINEFQHLSVKDYIQIDDTDTYLASFQLDNGYTEFATLKRGWNGKLKIEYTSHGSNTISYQSLKTNKGKYGILYGVNPDLKIDHIQKNYVSNFSFTVKLPPNEVFVAYHLIPEELTDQDDWSDYVLYDAVNKTIDIRDIK